jgi:hypothetical protein
VTSQSASDSRTAAARHHSRAPSAHSAALSEPRRPLHARGREAASSSRARNRLGTQIRNVQPERANAPAAATGPRARKACGERRATRAAISAISAIPQASGAAPWGVGPRRMPSDRPIPRMPWPSPRTLQNDLNYHGVSGDNGHVRRPARREPARNPD